MPFVSVRGRARTSFPDPSQTRSELCELVHSCGPGTDLPENDRDRITDLIGRISGGAGYDRYRQRIHPTFPSESQIIPGPRGGSPAIQFAPIAPNQLRQRVEKTGIQSPLF